MDWGIVVLLIVIIGAVTSTIQTAITGRGRRSPAPPPQRGTQVDDEVRALKERVAVLERIATDRNHSLELEIERLRER